MMVENLEGLTTAHLTDACVQQGMDPRLAPQEVVPMVPGIRVTGRVLPVRHAAGNPLFQQFRFAEYLEKHAADPSYSLRVHLQAIGRAIET